MMLYSTFVLTNNIIAAYYHSKECQVQHWKQHKSACTKIKEKHEKWKERLNNVLPDSSPLDTKEGPCAICLEETITNPVVMPCGHAFCFACVGHYQKSSTSKELLCPYCRGEIPNVGVKATERATLYSNRAHASSEGSEEQKKYAKLAVAEVDAFMELLNPEDKKTELCMHISFAKATMTAMIGQPEDTIAATDEVLKLNENHPGVLDFIQVEFTKCDQAEAYVALGKWEEAGKIYKTLYKSNLQSGGHNALVLMGLAQTKYELGKYDEAIKIGSVAMKEFRQCPGVHKCAALAHKAKGDIDEAKKTMSRAILYETHWDKDNMQKNKELLLELNNM